MKGRPALLEIFSLWRDTRHVVLVSALAAIYAAVLIPFKTLVLLPGVTEVRPAVALPVVFSLLFGPAAAWGSAIGNTIGDVFGSFGPGTFFGFIGNFLYGYVPHRVWVAWRSTPPRFKTAGDWMAFVLAVLAASGACAIVVGWGIDMLGLFPFRAIAGLVLLNNVLVSLALGSPLLIAITPRVARMNLLDSGDPVSASAGLGGRLVSRAATLVLAAGALAGILTGVFMPGNDPAGGLTAGAVTPYLVLVLLAAALI